MNIETNNIPKKLGKYQVIEKLANGSMGVVYEGYDPVADRPVAIKVSLSEHIKDKQQARRFNELFIREAKTASLLRHPNVLEVFDCGVDQGKHYIVMELVKHARTVKDYISEKALLQPEEALNLIIQCAEGLKYAHVQGVIHRDIKPANILVTEDMQIKLADFSIAFVEQPDFEMTMPTGFVGSPRYMSPEQVQEDVITLQSDLYSLGVVMYELLTGKHPFEAESFSRLIYKVVNEDPPDPLEIKPDLPEKLAMYIQHALIKDPAKRFQSASEMIKYLKRVYPKTSATVNTKEADNKEQLIKNKVATDKGTDLGSLIFFENFDKDDLQLIAESCLLLEFKKGDQIVQQNERDEGFYILVNGEISIERKVGESFGEVAFLSGEPHIFSIKAVSEVSILHINKNLLEQLPVACQLEMYKTLSIALAGKLRSVSNESSLSEAS